MSTVKTGSHIRPLDEFIKTHDKSYIVPSKIKAALKKLAEKSGWCYEVDFLKLADINANDLAAFREPFLADHVVLVKDTNKHQKRVWTGSKTLTEKLRGML